jgi:hypothetical protein
VPQIKTAAAEWERVQQQVRLGQRLVPIYYAVTMISPLGRGDANARTLKAMYKAANWDLTDETYLHLMGLLAAMPLLVPDGLSSDLRRFKRFKLMMSENVAALAPCRVSTMAGPSPSAARRPPRPTAILESLPEFRRQSQCRDRRQVRLWQIGAAPGPHRLAGRRRRQDDRHR